MTPLFKSSERVCLDTAPDFIKQEPYGPYMNCVSGQCKCRQVEVSQEMILAGIDAMSDQDPRYSDSSQVVANIFRAMKRAEKAA